MRKRRCGLLCLAVAAVLILAGCGVVDYASFECGGVRYVPTESARTRGQERQTLESYGLYGVPPEDMVGEELEAIPWGEDGTQYFYRVAGLDSLDIVILRHTDGTCSYLIKEELYQND